MHETYYIDGYNLLHQSPEWKALANSDLEAARNSLIEAVGAWCATAGNRAIIFFDGQGRRVESAPKGSVPPNLEVLYTSSRLTADAVIERGVYKSANRDKVIVVSGDHGILDLCRGMGALSLSPDNFLIELARDSAQLTQSVENTQTKTRMATLEQHLGEDSQQQLEQLKKKLSE